MNDVTFRNGKILVGDVLERLADLPDDSVHMCVTSPPYWGLRDYGEDDQLGLEPTPEAYVENMVAVFREVRCVLRLDGTLWLNLGDTYSGGGGAAGKPDDWDDMHDDGNYPSEPPAKSADGLKPKNLVGIPWRVAFALQQDGWWLRSDIIWAKGISLDKRMGSCMPESVTDRPTSAHEHIFLLSPSKQYFYDHEAVKEDLLSSPEEYLAAGDSVRENHAHGQIQGRDLGDSSFKSMPSGGNLRNVWHTSPQPYPNAHFAVYPPNLIRPCIQAGTSEKGCCAECGAPWERVVEVEKSSDSAYEARGKTRKDAVGPQEKYDYNTGFKADSESTTIGWEPTCDHDTEPVPCTVLDPFLGSGTTALVAAKQKRDFVGIELNPDYVQLATERIQAWANQARLGEFK